LKIITFDRVHFSYQGEAESVSVINNVSFGVEEGEFVSIIGPSGCGKSTMLSLLSGLNFPSRGQIAINGEMVKGPGKERCVVFQHYSLFPWMNARKNIIFGLEQQEQKKSKREMANIADEYLELVGLRDAGNKYPNQLSGGMQQRVAIARAFAMDTDVLLMDEPFSAVDAKNRMGLQDILLKLWDNGGKKKTVVFVTHDVDEAILLSDRIIVMSIGRGIKDNVKLEFERPRKRSSFTKSESYHQLKHRLIESLFVELVEEAA
jgi:NitT/TauT family transport system ATP-binding protein